FNWKDGVEREVIIDNPGNGRRMRVDSLIERWEVNVDEKAFVESPENLKWILAGADVDVSSKFIRRLTRGQDGDRRKANYRIMKLCLENGLEAPQVFSLMREQMDEDNYKYEGDKRLAEDIARIYAKGIDVAGVGAGITKAEEKIADFNPRGVGNFGVPGD